MFEFAAIGTEVVVVEDALSLDDAGVEAREGVGAAAGALEFAVIGLPEPIAFARYRGCHMLNARHLPLFEHLNYTWWMVLAPSTEELQRLLHALSGMSPARDDAERIERIRRFEELKAAVSAAQAVESLAFDRSQRAAQAVAGAPATVQGRGVASQLALAMRVSPWRAQRWLGWAKIITSELPAAFAELQAGRTSEWRTMLLARETAGLARADRAAVDAEVAPHLERFGDRQVETEARRAAYRLDPHAVVARARQAEADRRVSVRPAPDTMCRLSALLPVAQGVAAYAALTRAADLTTAGGDERGRGQIMADTLVQRLTGQVAAPAVPVEIELLMSDQTLLGAGDEPALLPGYGPVPAGIARDLALGRTDDGGAATGEAERWVRRLFRDPTTGQLAALDSTRRRFTAGQRRFLRLRDQTCRTPWCGAPIRHADHILPHHEGGPTSVTNGQGLCQACNYARQGPGWHARPHPSDGSITVRTPTGHRYRSELPDPPAGRLRSQPVAEIRLWRSDTLVDYRAA